MGQIYNAILSIATAGRVLAEFFAPTKT